MIEKYKLLYNLLLKEKIYGLHSIRCILYILIIIFILKINKNCEIINYLNHNYYITYNFNIKCINVINNIINYAKNIDFININELFVFYLNNDTINNIKNYNKYYNYPLLTKWIVNNIIKPEPNLFILDGNLKINSYLNETINYYKNNNYTINYEYLYGYQDNQFIKEITNLELFLNTNYNFNSKILSHNILFNDINNINYNIIFFDITNNDIHNIIHAKCCEKIKKLKIRGTKFEPLILQLILKSLDNNGKAIIIVPFSLLFCDSILHTETRKYLLDNYNLKKIIEIDDTLNLIKNIKKFILYIENNNNNNNNLEFSKIRLDATNNIIEENIINIEYNKIINNNYILYSNMYINNNIVNNKLKYVNILNYFNLYYNINDIINNNNDNNDNLLGISKYYKNKNFIKIILINEINNNSDYILYMIEKKNDEFIKNFLYFYIEYTVNNKYNNFIKGTKIDIEKIKLINIPIINKEIQKIIYNYNLYSNKLYNYNLTQIELYQNLSKCIFDSLFYCSEKIELKQLIEFVNYNNINIIENNYIAIYKNKVLLNNIININNNNNLLIDNNMYYLKLIDNNFIIDFIYNYLIYLSNYNCYEIITNKILIENILIPIINIENQKEIVTNINFFNSVINKHNIDNDNIKNKDIINLILKLNNLC